MKLLKGFLAVMLMMSVTTTMHAADSTSLTRSAGKLLSDTSVELNEKLSGSPLLISAQSKSRTIDNPAASISTLSYRTANHDIAVEFEIFDAWVELSGDIDNDGYFHRINTTFDADVNTPLETVYAKLYLSYEGGPWQQYADSDLFEISYDSINDTYEIVSELIEGYPPGYYDVLIELHSLYHEGIVASRIITQDTDGYLLTIEDQQHDEYYVEEYYYPETDLYIETGVVHAGSFTWTGIIILALLLMIKFRCLSNKTNEH